MRPDLEIIQQWVEPGHHVLDLGCGDGTLLDFLQRERGASGFGLEINPDRITTCMGKGVSVIEQNLDTQGLDNFDDGMFDVVLMTQALQAVRRPDKVIEEMLRVGREGIVTFPNFAHWRLRWGLALSRQKGIRIKSRRVVDGQHQNSWLARLWPNLLGEIAIYRITRENP